MPSPWKTEKPERFGPTLKTRVGSEHAYLLALNFEQWVIFGGKSHSRVMNIGHFHPLFTVLFA